MKCRDCTTCAAASIMPFANKNASCDKCPSGLSANAARTACGVGDICDDTKQGCTQVQVDPMKTECRRKICEDENSVLPDATALKRWKLNMSASVCASKTPSDWEIPSDAFCRKCTKGEDGKGGLCHHGWCTGGNNHDPATGCTSCKHGFYSSVCRECPSGNVGMVWDIMVFSFSVYVLPWPTFFSPLFVFLLSCPFLHPSKVRLFHVVFIFLTFAFSCTPRPLLLCIFKCSPYQFLSNMWSFPPNTNNSQILVVMPALRPASSQVHPRGHGRCRNTGFKHVQRPRQPDANPRRDHCRNHMVERTPYVGHSSARNHGDDPVGGLFSALVLPRVCG
jgi:hypothetical protein